MKLSKAVSKNLGGKTEHRMINGIAEKKKKNDVKTSLSRETAACAQDRNISVAAKSGHFRIFYRIIIDIIIDLIIDVIIFVNSDNDFRTVSRENQSHSNCDLSINILIRNSIRGSRDDCRPVYHQHHVGSFLGRDICNKC